MSSPECAAAGRQLVESARRAHNVRVTTAAHDISSSADDRVLTVAERIARAREISLGMRVDQASDVVRPPGPSRLDVTVAAFTGQIPTLDFMGRMFGTFPISHAQVGPEHLYALSDPELIWEVFATHDGDTRRSRALQATRPILGNGILTSEEPEHRRNRSLVQPAFSPRRIKAYGDQMVRATKRIDELWTQRWRTGDTDIVVSSEMADLTLDIVGQTLFGADLTNDANEISEALTLVLGRFGQMLSPVGMVLMRLPTRRRARLVSAVERLDAVVVRMIEAKKAQLAAGIESDDMLAALIEARDEQGERGLSINELRDEVMTLVLAGHETTANALSWTWLELSMNPIARQWVQQEWDDVGAGRDLTIEDIDLLPRTRAVVAESMRLHPPAWIVSRRLTTDLELAGYRVPAGSTLFASQYFLHRSPRFWDAPDDYVPGRWLDADGAYDEKAPGQPRAAWFPFGFASRKCIGDRFALAEAVLALATLGRNWEVVAKDPQAVLPVPAITLRPNNGIPARIRPRTR